MAGNVDISNLAVKKGMHEFFAVGKDIVGGIVFLGERIGLVFPPGTLKKLGNISYTAQISIGKGFGAIAQYGIGRRCCIKG